VPGHAHLAAGVTRGEQAAELRVTGLVEAFVGLGEQAPGPVERVVLAASVAEGVVLHPPAAFIQLRVGELDHMERVSDLRDMSEGLREGLAVGAGEVQHAVADRLPPAGGAGLEPGAGAGGGAAGDDVEELTASHVHDRGAPPLSAPAAGPAEQGLVQAERVDRPDAAGVFDQRCPVGDDRVVDGVPVTTQLCGDLGHGAAQPADLCAGPAARSIRHRPTHGGDPRVLGGPGAHRAVPVRAAPAVLAPHQPGRATEARQVHQLDQGTVLHPRRCATCPATGSFDTRLDMHTDRLAGLVVDGEDGHIGQADEQRAHARSVGLHRGSGGAVGVGTTDSPSPCAAPGGPQLHPYTPLRSEAPQEITAVA